jgi:hypothetical protein
MTTRSLVLVSLLFAACAVSPRHNGGDDTVGGGGGGGGGGSGHPPPDGQYILMLDFRSGWWAGSAGDFHKTVLDPLRNASNDITIEFHHFTVGSDVKCVYPRNQPSNFTCNNLTMSASPTPDEVLAEFDRQRWDDYTQVWILSGSHLDQSDIVVNGDLFQSFVQQAGASCIPVYIGAGDGFIDHGNAIAQALGIGTILSTQLASPGFFFGTPNPTIDSWMNAGVELTSHELFNGVTKIADGVANPFLQKTHGDALVPNPLVTVLAHDSLMQPSIGIGSLGLADGTERPFIIDAGNQRYYGVLPAPDTMTLLQNIRRYLATHGCRAVIQ